MRKSKDACCMMTIFSTSNPLNIKTVKKQNSIYIELPKYSYYFVMERVKYTKTKTSSTEPSKLNALILFENQLGRGYI